VTVAVLVAWFCGSLLFAHFRVEKSDALPTTADRVVIVGVPGLTLDDLHEGPMPRLAELASTGAVAATNVRGGGTSPEITEAYATVGAGYRIESGTTGSRAVDVAAGHEPPAVRVLDMPPGPDPDAEDETGRPGSLAVALQAAGRRTAVVANADVMIRGRRSVSAPAAVAAATPAGAVAEGTVGRSLTTVDPDAPGGIATSPDAFVAATRRALTRADLVVVDPGITTRLDRADRLGLVDASPGRYRQALYASDAIIGDLAERLDPRTALIVVGVTPPTSTWQLTPMIIAGAGVQTGHLKSPSTHRPDLVTITDVAPTALALLGIAEPVSMSGHVLRVRPGGTDLSRMRAFDEMLVSRRSTDQPMTLVFILVQSALYAAGVVLLMAGRLSTRRGSALLFSVLTCAAWPLATFWIRGSLTASSLGLGTAVATWLIAAAVAGVACVFRRHPLDPLLAICAATVATIVLDLSTGAHLQYGSFFGYAPNKGTRFTGIGNAAFALLAAATVVVCTALVSRARDRSRGWWGAAVVAAAVVAADGAPWMGSDVGGILSLVPVLGLLMWTLSGRSVRWRTVGYAALGALAALAVAVGLDALRAPDQRTHVSRFFLNLGDWSMVRGVIAEKWSMNMRLLRQSAWAWLVPITVALSLVALTVGRLWQHALPPRSPQRAGVIATLVLALVGWLLNDSGIVVVALASVYVGPYVLLLARENEPDPSPPHVAEVRLSEPQDA